LQLSGAYSAQDQKNKEYNMNEALVEYLAAITENIVKEEIHKDINEADEIYTI
jgi:hypothetical protein